MDDPERRRLSPAIARTVSKTTPVGNQIVKFGASKQWPKLAMIASLFAAGTAPRSRPAHGAAGFEASGAVVDASTRAGSGLRSLSSGEAGEPIAGRASRSAFAGLGAAALSLFAFRRLRDREARQKRAVLKAVSIAGQRALADPAIAFPRQIVAAAERSVWFGRTAGIVYFEIPADGAASPAGRQAKSKRLAASVASQIWRMVDDVDFVHVMNGGEIVICLPLLSGATELRERAERLGDSREQLKLTGAPSLAKAGTAIYPLDGYDGESLIAVARAKCRVAQGKAQSSSPYVLVEPAARIRLMGDALARRRPVAATPRARTSCGRFSRFSSSQRRDRVQARRFRPAGAARIIAFRCSSRGTASNRSDRSRDDASASCAAC